MSSHRIVEGAKEKLEIQSSLSGIRGIQSERAFLIAGIIFFFFFTAEVSACLFIFLGITIAIFHLGFTILKVKF